jgi:hypothetical protein
VISFNAATCCYALKSNKGGNVFYPTCRVSDFPETFLERSGVSNTLSFVRPPAGLSHQTKEEPRTKCPFLGPGLLAFGVVLRHDMPRRLMRDYIPTIQTIAVGFGLIGVAQALRLVLLIFAATY